MRSIFVGLVCLAIALPANAEEQVLHEAIVVQGGLLCDSVDEVKSFITVHEERSGVVPSGCGVLQAPAVMRVIAIATFETPRRKYLLVRYEFLSSPMPPQYGIGGVRDNGEPA